MKKFFAFVLLLFFVNNSYASTVVSRFTERQYALKHSFKKVWIIVKKEHTADYFQPSGDADIKQITYGYGDMKIKGVKKFGILYICLLDTDSNPIRSYVILTK